MSSDGEASEVRSQDRWDCAEGLGRTRPGPCGPGARLSREPEIQTKPFQDEDGAAQDQAKAVHRSLRKPAGETEGRCKSERKQDDGRVCKKKGTEVS